MKQKLLFLTLVTSAALFGSCSNEQINDTPSSIGEEVEHIFVTLPPMTGLDIDSANTRAEFNYNGETDRFDFVWSEGDVLGVFPNVGAQVDFPIAAEYVGTNSAEFDGGGWALKTGYRYAVYAPYDYYNRDKTKIPMDYTGQTQKAANDYSHINKYNYFASNDAIVASGPTLDFKVGFMGTLIWMPLTMPFDATLKEIRLTSDNLYFITKAHLDISDEKPKFTPVTESQTVSLKLNNIAVSAGVESNFYMWILPRDFRTSNLTIQIVTTEDKVYETRMLAAGSTDKANMTSGNYLRARRPNTNNPLTYKGSEANKVVNAMKALHNAFTNAATVLPDWPDAPTSANDYADKTGVTVQSGKIVAINLSGKGLTGTIPESIGDLTDLETLDLSNNNLTGVIPESIGNLTNLTTLDLSGNNLTSTGSGNDAAPQLATSDVASSEAPTLITAFPTTIGNLTKLMYLNLGNNKLSGEIPSSIGNLKVLQNLILNNNQLSGALPTFIGNLTALVVLDLSSNSLTGDFTDWFFNKLPEIPTLQYLYVGNNNLTGEITEDMQDSERWQNLNNKEEVTTNTSIVVVDPNAPKATIEDFEEKTYTW